MYFFEGSDGLMDLILLYCKLLFHQALVPFFVSSLICCLTADRLTGRFLQRKGGSRSLSLEPNSAACFASLSAASFPIESIWPATQVSVTSMSGLFIAFCLILFAFSCLCNRLILHLTLSIRYCAGCGRLLAIVL